MSNKIKVYNVQKFCVGVTLLDKPLGMNIKPGSFAQMTEDDIEYLMSTSTLFQRGLLRVEEKASEIISEQGIDMATDPNFADDTVIKEKLALSAKKLTEWLDTVHEPHVLDRIYDVAMEANLPMAKLKVLHQKMPDRNILGS